MIVRTRKLSDKNIQILFKKIALILPDFRVSGAFAGEQEFAFDDKESFEKIPKGSNERLINKIVIRRLENSSDYVEFSRGIMIPSTGQNKIADQLQFINREPSAYFDEIALFSAYNRNNIPRYLSFSEEESVAIWREIGRFEAPIADLDTQNADAYGKLLDQNISDLQRVSVEFIERASLAREADEASFRKREKSLQEQFANKLSEIEKQRAALEQQKLELNDREPQHERRRLRESLTRELRNSLGAPSNSDGKISYVYYCYFAVALIFILVSVVYALNPSSVADASFWARMVKGALAGIAGAAFAWAGLSGFRDAAISQREYERYVQRYAFDMDRASWIVETLLQMNSNEQMRIPDDWLRSVCQSLFDNDSASDRGTNSLESFAALFDATSRAKLGTNGIEFEIDKKGAKKLASEAG